jgi:hypothetical protein
LVVESILQKYDGRFIHHSHDHNPLTKNIIYYYRAIKLFDRKQKPIAYLSFEKLILTFINYFWQIVDVPTWRLFSLTIKKIN